MTSPAHPTTAHYFWEGLTDLGVEYVFGNLGTDHVSLIEELARWDREGRPHPQMVLCPHENVAMHMAAGYAAVTGKGQAVMVHVDAGTANAAMGMHNMFRARLPVMLIAGKAPFTLRGELPGSRDNYVHFVQDPFDIASLVRPYVKWEYSLPSGVMAQEALRRGHAMMESDPPGPVYLTLPREVLAETWPPEKAKAFSAQRYGSVAAGGVDEARVLAMAQQLLHAKQPVVVTSYLGRKPEAVDALQALASIEALCASLLRLQDSQAVADALLYPWVQALLAQCREQQADLLWLQPLGLAPGARQDVPSLRALADEGSVPAPARMAQLNQLAQQAAALAQADYSFLYNPQRHLMAVGYNVDEHRLDSGHYDLLASEARLCSFVAIAQGAVPQDNWFALGRLLTTAGQSTALLSWSGSMFEYLMPSLVLDEPEGSALRAAARCAVPTAPIPAIAIT